MHETIEALPLRDILRYMGYKGAPDPRVKELAERASAMLLEACDPMWLYAVSKLERTDGGILMTRLGLLLPGRNIARLLDGCRRAALLCATLSAGADRLIDRLSITDMALAHAVDCCAASAVEELCDRAMERISSQLGSPLTPRYSPGFGDLPLDIQPRLLDAARAGRQLGLTVTDSLLLTPRKSVTAVIGVKDAPRPASQARP